MRIVRAMLTMLTILYTMLYTILTVLIRMDCTALV